VYVYVQVLVFFGVF